jgi:hypothetical protein
MRFYNFTTNKSVVTTLFTESPAIVIDLHCRYSLCADSPGVSATLISCWRNTGHALGAIQNTSLQ